MPQESGQALSLPTLERYVEVCLYSHMLYTYIYIFTTIAILLMIIDNLAVKLN